MIDLKQYIRAVPDFPQPGILFRDIMPLLRAQFEQTIAALDATLSAAEWQRIDAVAGVESRGFILGAALAVRRGKGFVAIRKQGRLPPPVTSLAYDLEYGSATLEMQPGSGALLIVDDVIATGGTLTAAAELSAASGFDVSAVIALVDLKLIPPLRWHDLAVRSVVAYD